MTRTLVPGAAAQCVPDQNVMMELGTGSSVGQWGPAGTAAWSSWADTDTMAAAALEQMRPGVTEIFFFFPVAVFLTILKSTNNL